MKKHLQQTPPPHGLSATVLKSDRRQGCLYPGGIFGGGVAPVPQLDRRQGSVTNAKTSVHGEFAVNFSINFAKNFSHFVCFPRIYLNSSKKGSCVSNIIELFGKDTNWTNTFYFIQSVIHLFAAILLHITISVLLLNIINHYFFYWRGGGGMRPHQSMLQKWVRNFCLPRQEPPMSRNFSLVIPKMT